MFKLQITECENHEIVKYSFEMTNVVLLLWLFLLHNQVITKAVVFH